jgi:hypothetical protein
MRHAFVIGCSRSGTTAITNLLNEHDEIVIGMERFKHEYPSSPVFRPGPEWFEEERFFRFHPSETNITPAASPRWAAVYKRAASKFERRTIRVIGDKVLAHARILRNMAASFPDARYMFIFRDLARVTSSYCIRAANPKDVNWPETKTHRSALLDWTGAFEAALGLMDSVGPERVLPVQYERLFSGDIDTFRSLFEFLGFDVTSELVESFRALTKGWEERTSQPLHVDPEQQRYLDDHANLDLEQRFIDMASERVREAARRRQSWFRTLRSSEFRRYLRAGLCS